MLDNQGRYWVSPTTFYFTYPANQEEQQCFVYAGCASLFNCHKWPKPTCWELAVGSMTWYPARLNPLLVPALRIVNIKFKIKGYEAETGNS